MERKFIDLKELKVSDDGAGTIEGYRAVFSEIDSGGDILVPGAFKDCIAEYLRSGFTAESHDWDFSKSVGFPVEAKEDEYGWFVKSQFHSTPDAQNVRTKAQERFAAGKQVGFSFGYKTDAYTFIEQKDFAAELPKYIKADRLEENMKKAQAFSRIRILKKVSAIEDSLVTAPMNKMAMATGVKSEGASAETKGMFEDALEERTEGLYFLYDVLCCALYRAQMVADADPAFDLAMTIDVILGEFTARVRAGILDPEEMDDMGAEMASFRGPISFKGDLRGGLPFAKHTETVLGAVEVFANKGAVLTELVSGWVERRKQITELREAKAGAVYSGSNLSHMQRIHDAIGKVKKDVSSAHSDMAALIAKAKKPEKSEDGEIDVAALRAQTREARNRAIEVLYT